MQHPKTDSYWLSLDLTSRSGSMAIHSIAASGPELLRERKVDDEGNHSERLLIELKTLLYSASLNLKQIDRFVCASGPGSFTGLRIAMATWKAFAYALNRPVETVSASEAKALGWRQESKIELQENDAILVLTRVSTRKHTQAFFELAGKQRLHRKGEQAFEQGAYPWPEIDGTLYVLGDASLAGELKAKKVFHESSFQMSARHLGSALPFAETRASWVDLAQWVSLSPEYFGTSIGEKKPPTTSGA